LFLVAARFFNCSITIHFGTAAGDIDQFLLFRALLALASFLSILMKITLIGKADNEIRGQETEYLFSASGQLICSQLGFLSRLVYFET
jgi:hypothetical protein